MARNDRFFDEDYFNYDDDDDDDTSMDCVDFGDFTSNTKVNGGSYQVKSSSHTGGGDENDDQPYVEILNAHQIVTLMNAEVSESADVLRLPPVYCRLLLQHFRWDKAKMLEDFFNSALRTGILKKAGIPVAALIRGACKKPFASLVIKSNQTSFDFKCGICLEHYPDGSDSSPVAVAAGCGHKFCASCCISYITSRTLENGVGTALKCPALDCNYLYDDDLVLILVQNADVRWRYVRLIANTFVDANRLMTWCPGEDCENALRIAEFSNQTVNCTSCGASFCFSCRRPGHRPITCEVLDKWLKLMLEAPGLLSNMKWVAENTKPCPRCKSPIEKNGGCNSMICSKCSLNFCWMCLTDFSHGHYSCNVYAQNVVHLQQTRMADLERLKHFVQRFEGHKSSMKLENSIRPTMEKWLEERACLNELSFLSHAVVVLRHCRETLVYSYVFAFFLEPSNQSAFFECNQADLQQATEILSGYLEQQVPVETLAAVKSQLPDKARNCESRMRALFEHIQEGYKLSWWKMNLTSAALPS